MEWKAVSASGNGRRNDDLVRVLEHGAVTDVLVLDGATSLAERDYIDAVDGDPAWFVRAFAEAFAAVAPASGADDQEAIVQRALARVREARALRAGAGGNEGPLYAWPIAALSWIRIRREGAGHLLQLYCLGDCKVLLGAGGQVRDLDPYDNAYEHRLQRAVADLVADGVTDPAERFAALTPLLRARREEQQLGQAPEVLCLAPHGQFGARRYEHRTGHDAEGGALLLAMTDGYYRLVDPYAIYDDAALLRACERDGPEELLAELRRFEAARDTAALSVKGADDASAVALRLGARDKNRLARAEVGMTQEQERVPAQERALVERYVAAYNAFDIDAMLATLADGVRFENHGNGELTVATDGVAAFRRLAEQSKSLFSEREQRIGSLERRDGKVVAAIAFRGRLAADIPGGPAAGSVIELAGRSEFGFANGRIVSIIDRS